MTAPAPARLSPDPAFVHPRRRQRNPVRKPALSRVWALGLAVALVLVGAAGAYPGHRVAVAVLRVVDGDTVVVGIGGRAERVRLLGIDTPEVARDGRPGEPFARAAERFTRGRLAQARGVELEVAGDRVDDHGRTLGFLWLREPGRSERSNLSEELLRAGLARALRRFDYPGKARFLTLEAEARRAGLGLWRARP